MITVNLRPDLKRKRARQLAKGLMDARTGCASWAAKVKDPLLVAVGELGVRARLARFRLISARARELNALEPQLEQSRRREPRFKAFLAEKRHQETIRDSLVAQITVIRGVDGDRYVWPHLLDEVTKALAGLHLAGGPRPRPPLGPGLSPPRPTRPASVPSLTVPTAPRSSPSPWPFQVNGRTVDIQAYTRFLRQLEASPWITDVTPVSAQTVVEKERPVTAFTIRATYQPSGLGVHPDGSPQPVGEVGSHGTLASEKSDAAPRGRARRDRGLHRLHRHGHRLGRHLGPAGSQAQVVAVRDTIATARRGHRQRQEGARPRHRRGSAQAARDLSRQPVAAAPPGARAERGAQPARRHLEPRARSAG